MTSNPLVDISEKLKQQRLDQRIQNIEAEIEKFKGVQHMKLLEVEVYQSDSISKVMVNPDQIEYVDNNCAGHAVLHMTSGAVLQATRSWEAIISSSDSPNNAPTYIK